MLSKWEPRVQNGRVGTYVLQVLTFVSTLLKFGIIGRVYVNIK